ncbi:MAG: GNAT family N-acetyltransferase [Synergistaceae bacterium]|nr:GNAT family N-acetyltransferase [Synergistaceae bacterium]
MKIEKLSKGHHRAAFDCGNDALNNYLRTRAAQDVKHNVTTVFVAVEKVDDIAGFYTLSATSLHRKILSAETERRLPKYQAIPAILLGRLTVALDFQGTGLGGRLLLNAFERCSRIELAWAFLVTDAKDEQARAFYSHYGFFSLQDDPNHLCLPRKTIIDVMTKKQQESESAL